MRLPEPSDDEIRTAFERWIHVSSLLRRAELERRERVNREATDRWLRELARVTGLGRLVAR